MRIIGLKKRIGQRIWPLVIASVLLLSCSVVRAEVFFIHNDHLGTPRAMTDKSGAVIWKAKYEPFGKATVTKTPSTVTPNPPDLNIRFPGQYFDAETGLHYNYYRDYDPSTGRYLQPDPIGLDGGVNPYAYVDNNPLRYVDPFGLVPPNDIPLGVAINRNIREASGMSPFEFYDSVRNGGKWDYKQSGRKFEDFGNYNYGVTGRAAEFGSGLLRRAAGWAQGRAGTRDPSFGSPFGGPPYGDAPRDQRWIDEGMHDFDSGYWDWGSSKWDKAKRKFCQDNPNALQCRGGSYCP